MQHPDSNGEGVAGGGTIAMYIHLLPPKKLSSYGEASVLVTAMNYLLLLVVCLAGGGILGWIVMSTFDGMKSLFLVDPAIPLLALFIWGFTSIGRKSGRESGRNKDHSH